MRTFIHHNPDCGTSRNVLEILHAAGAEPVVRIPPDRLDPPAASGPAAAGLTWRMALRASKSPAEELGLLNPDVSDSALLAHPVLVNRPIVCTPDGVRLCRPSEVALDLLDRLPPWSLYKEDGTMILNERGGHVD